MGFGRCPATPLTLHYQLPKYAIQLFIVKPAPPNPIQPGKYPYHIKNEDTPEQRLHLVACQTKIIRISIGERN